jgi:hypothetical protein
VRFIAADHTGRSINGYSEPAPSGNTCWVPVPRKLITDECDGEWGEATATFSADRKHRFRLTRVWDSAQPRCAFVMLNPSTADAFRVDPTNRRCLDFARRWGYGSLDVVNLFSIRSTDPAGIRRAARPSRSENDDAIAAAAADANLIVAGWGHHGRYMDRANLVCEGPLQSHALVALRTTKAGHPGHPLYLPGSSTPVPWSSPAIS